MEDVSAEACTGEVESCCVELEVDRVALGELTINPYEYDDAMDTGEGISGAPASVGSGVGATDLCVDAAGVDDDCDDGTGWAVESARDCCGVVLAGGRTSGSPCTSSTKPPG